MIPALETIIDEYMSVRLEWDKSKLTGDVNDTRAAMDRLMTDLVIVPNDDNEDFIKEIASMINTNQNHEPKAVIAEITRLYRDCPEAIPALVIRTLLAAGVDIFRGWALPKSINDFVDNYQGSVVKVGNDRYRAF